MKKRVFGVHHQFVVKLEKIGQRQIGVKIISVGSCACISTY